MSVLPNLPARSSELLAGHVLAARAESAESTADVRLARDALAGSESARRAFIARMGCVVRMLGARNRQLAAPFGHAELEELIQRTLVAIWGRLATFSGRASLETWVCTFCNYNLMTALRERVQRRRAQDSLPDVAMESIESDAERFEALYRALAEARGVDAEILRWKHFDELTFEQIAARVGRSPSTVKSAYYAALERLRTRLLAAENRALA